jgi:hypothetical protein
MKSSQGAQQYVGEGGDVVRRGLIRGGLVALGGLALGLLGVRSAEGTTRDGRVAIPKLRMTFGTFLTPGGMSAALSQIPKAVRLRPGETVRYWVSCIEDRPEEWSFGRRHWRIANIYCSPDGVKVCSFEEGAYIAPEI